MIDNTLQELGHAIHALNEIEAQKDEMNSLIEGAWGIFGQALYYTTLNNDAVGLPPAMLLFDMEEFTRKLRKLYDDAKAHENGL